MSLLCICSSQHKNKYASTSVNIHNFKYRRNRNRSSRYVEDLPEPNSEVSDISIGMYVNSTYV